MNEWQEASLIDLGSVERGRSRHRPRNDSRLFGEEMPFFQTGDVKAATLHMTSAGQYYSDFGVAQSRVWEPGVTCITIAANIAESAVLGRRGCFPDSVLGFTPAQQPDDAYFVKYLLDVHRERLTSAARGTAQDNLSLEKLLAHRFPMPGPVTRCRIAGVLRSLDELIENNRRRSEVLEEMVRAIFREWFVHFRYPGHGDSTLVPSLHGPIPAGWTCGTVQDMVELVKTTVDPGSVDPATPAVGLEHIPRRHLTLDAWDTAEGLGSRKSVFAAGDILFGKIRPYFHKVSVAPIDGICSTDAIVLRPLDDHWGQAVMTVSSGDFVAYATQTSNGTKMPRADWKVIKEFPVTLPSAEVAQRFNAVARDALQTAELLMFQSRELASTRDLLLPKLVLGQVDVSSLNLDAVVEGEVE
ncbi:restriction endonuclease subunit S [Streptomyces sp. NPDC002039]|uniref:restriction endonuclease subunit S n=1 Tax=Streptomyces sp. NPDC002039 TaxID=3154660 RepID=UPI00332A0BBE